ncbi:unnamed protein product [Pleuronectes platessa]|uniref:Uncharacterized protein n=1 Tax=Pleuronectes platessa TaxID=8262 RepID=A0A9N7Z8S4_PLEPL|nr:unnamed protein product [Pleuronectes platessa]
MSVRLIVSLSGFRLTSGEKVSLLRNSVFLFWFHYDELKRCTRDPCFEPHFPKPPVKESHRGGEPDQLVLQDPSQSLYTLMQVYSSLVSLSDRP